MARKRFKKWWKKLIPVPIERSVYAIFSSAIIWLSMMYWQPMTGIVWDFQNIFIKGLFYALFFLGAGITVYAIIVLDLFDYVGLRQIHLHFQPGGYVPLEFKTPSIYKYIRHPMVVGVCTFFWATPKMTIGHFIFAAGMTLYSFIGLQFEERNLISEHGEKYEKYKQTVRAILPLPKTSY
jgi:protein-S-isoprenylcysteine O-methyltransferase Ste14